MGPHVVLTGLERLLRKLGRCTISGLVLHRLYRNWVGLSRKLGVILLYVLDEFLVLAALLAH